MNGQTPAIKLFFIAAILFGTASGIFGERLPIRVFTTADGLGSSFVDGVFRDSRGFMWFSTRDGLSRFDGARFIT
jgi:ligand-binding sensor domain-containing protein